MDGEKYITKQMKLNMFEIIYDKQQPNIMNVRGGI